MSKIMLMLLVVALVEVFSVVGQSTVGNCNSNSLNDAVEMQSLILDEIKKIQNRMTVCSYSCTQLEGLLGRYLNNMTQNLKNFNNRLELLDQNVQNIFEFSERLEVKFENLSKLSEKHDENIQSVGRLLEEHDRYSKNRGPVSSKVSQDFHGIITWPRDCGDIRKVGQNLSDVYRVYALGPGSLPVEILVYCDMNSSNETWLVFQRREDGSENFERSWAEYAKGFGNLRGEFWLGNNALHLLTSNRNYKLRVELEDFDGNKQYAEYEQFSIGSASDKYRLNVSEYSGNAGDDLAFHNGHQFSTIDADHDSRNYSCAQLYHGAWWYKACHSSNLNGLYLRGNHTSYADGIEWVSFRGHYYSLKTTEMKIAPRN